MDSKKTIFLPVIGLSCNSNCIMCSVDSCYIGSKKRHCPPDGTTKQVVDDLIRGIKDGYSRIEFTGGEVTIRDDIVYLIEKAKELGYKEIGISTNGILLSNKRFFDNLVKTGLTIVTVALHGHNKVISESITRTPGSFRKTVKGIKNALAYKNLVVSVDTVILSLNYHYILQIGKFIRSLGVTQWEITDLLPEGRAKKQYKNLSIKREEVAKALYSIRSLIDKFQSVILFAFSPCVVPSEILHNRRVRLVTVKQKIDIEDPLSYNRGITPEVLPQKSITDRFHQQHLNTCKKCIFRNQCPGIWTDYINLYGKANVEKEVSKLAKKYGYLRGNLDWRQ